MAGRIILDLPNPALDGDGDPIAGSTLTYYKTGTTTLAVIYSTEAADVPLINPLEADSAGRFVEVWANEIVDVAWKDALGAPIRTLVNIYPDGGASSGGGGFSAFETREDAMLAEIESDVSVIEVNRYASDRPIYPVKYELTTSNVYAFKSNEGAKRWTVASSEPVTPMSFGAYGTGTSHPIAAPDIANNPQWIGRPTNTPWQVGDDWDTVATQEAIYASVAQNSTPGVVTWNMSGGSINNRAMLVPTGYYVINVGLVSVAVGSYMAFEERLATRWLDYAVSKPCINHNALAYSTIDRLTVVVGASKDPGVAVVVFDYDAFYPGIATQQLTLNDIVINGSQLADIGLSISPSGGGAQGDTILINNPYISDCRVYGIATAGGNALSIQIMNGNAQNIWKTGIYAGGGSVFVNGMSFQTLANLVVTPVHNHITMGGADMVFAGGGGASSITEFANIRSENIISLRVISGSATMRNVGVGGGIQVYQWFDSYPYTHGTLVQANLNRVAIAVDLSGTADWAPLQVGSPSLTVFTDPTASWTVNQWAGYSFFYRYGSNGFTEHATIASNTATTVTLTSPMLSAAVASRLYMIGGSTAASVPTWASMPDGGNVNSGGTGQGFSITAASNDLTYGNVTLNIGDWVVIPGGDQIVISGLPTYIMPLIARVTALPMANHATLSKAAKRTVVDDIGYYGAPLLDNKISWIHADFDVTAAPLKIDSSSFNFGKHRDFPARATDIPNSTWGAAPNWRRPVGVGGSQYGETSVANPVQTPLVPTFSQPGTIDLSVLLNQGELLRVTPTGNINFTFPPVPVGTSRRAIFEITTNGTNYVITFGPTNVITPGTFLTGTVTGLKKFVTFMSDGENWVEQSRSSITMAWTPTVSAITTPPTGVTYTAQQGMYYEAGGFAEASWSVTVNSLGASGSGSVLVQGFPRPFTAGVPGVFGAATTALVGYTANASLAVQSRPSFGDALYRASNTASGTTTVSWANLVSGSNLSGTLRYPIF